MQKINIFKDENQDIIVATIAIDGNGRKAEHEAVGNLLDELLGYNVVITYNVDGKPSIQDYNISISHTRGLACVILSRNYLVGIDVEYQSDRINRIASRFLRSDEAYKDVGSRLIAWCAKEALYKLYSSLHLKLEEMRVDIDGRYIEESQTNSRLPFKTKRLLGYTLVYIWK